MKTHFERRRVDLDDPDWYEELLGAVKKGRDVSKADGFFALAQVVLLLAAASAGLYSLEGMGNTFLLATSMFVGVVCICYVLVRTSVGVETSLTIMGGLLEVYGNQVLKRFSGNKLSKGGIFEYDE